MFAARLITVILLLMAILIAYNPQFHELLVHTWETLKPVVIHFMDGFYATIRTLIAGDGWNNQMEHPPIEPGVNFDRIVT